MDREVLRESDSRSRDELQVEQVQAAISFEPATEPVPNHESPSGIRQVSDSGLGRLPIAGAPSTAPAPSPNVVTAAAFHKIISAITNPHQDLQLAEPQQPESYGGGIASVNVTGNFSE
jgi:hypothetical protein